MLKNILIYSFFLMALLFTKNVNAQSTTEKEKDENKQSEPKTLLGGDNKHFGFYFSIGSKFANLNGQTAPMPTVKFAMSGGRKLAIGFEACGLPPSVRTQLNNMSVRAVGGYAGFFFEPIFASNKLIHLSMPILIGGGWMGFIDDVNSRNDFNGAELRDKSVIGIIEPNILAEVNITKFLRFNMGVGYRFTKNTNFAFADQNYFKGYHSYIGFKIGRF